MHLKFGYRGINRNIYNHFQLDAFNVTTDMVHIVLVATEATAGEQKNLAHVRSSQDTYVILICFKRELILSSFRETAFGYNSFLLSKVLSLHRSSDSFLPRGCGDYAQPCKLPFLSLHLCKRVFRKRIVRLRS
jgi:hypothetical protein